MKTNKEQIEREFAEAWDTREQVKRLIQKFCSKPKPVHGKKLNLRIS